MRASFASIAVTICTVLMAGCSNQFAGLEAGTVMVTDKTFGDHIVSWAAGKDCSTVRWEQGRTYCKEDEPRPEPAVFCYQSLGDVVCYDRPDPHNNAHQKVGEYEHNLPK
ncbi:hypothetical protein [Magnetospira sp. QH-2]|uniref:hypothetical protein n=1 Tax=Magnetospira sp. (strain QH-2) TaxID=1288970 RepID=UPI0003E81811|nr:hypothetical protein [Magnetospira sp. QH-2]CCQ74075.1 Exported protein of unknown function [Magnetospira sp. QH-2]